MMFSELFYGYVSARAQFNVLIFLEMQIRNDVGPPDFVMPRKAVVETGL